MQPNDWEIMYKAQEADLVALRRQREKASRAVNAMHDLACALRANARQKDEGLIIAITSECAKALAALAGEATP